MRDVGVWDAFPPIHIDVQFTGQPGHGRSGLYRVDYLLVSGKGRPCPAQWKRLQVRNQVVCHIFVEKSS